MTWQSVKELVKFKIPTFTTWIVTRPFAVIWDIDYKSAIWLSLGITFYAYFTNNRILTMIFGIIFTLTFLRAEYERGEWVHWYRERFKQKAIKEAEKNE